MTVRQKSLKVGQTVILKNPESSYQLPKGLESGTTATLKAHGYGSLTIDQNGKEWQIADSCIEHEFEYQVKPNCWLPKDHPMTIAAIEAEKNRANALIEVQHHKDLDAVWTAMKPTVPTRPVPTLKSTPNPEIVVFFPPKRRKDPKS